MYMYIFYFIFKLPSLHRCVIFWIPLTKQRMVHVLQMIFLKCLICRSCTFYQVKNRKKKILWKCSPHWPGFWNAWSFQLLLPVYMRLWACKCVCSIHNSKLYVCVFKNAHSVIKYWYTSSIFRLLYKVL